MNNTESEIGFHRIHNLALVAASLDDPFPRQVTEGAARAAHSLGENLFIFPVKYLQSEQIYGNDVYQRYEYQYRCLAYYAAASSIDCALITLDSIGYLTDQESCSQFLSIFDNAGIPVILIASPRKGRMNISFDNRSGLRAGMEYLIQDRHRRHFLFVRGKNENADDDERECVVREMLEGEGCTGQSQAEFSVLNVLYDTCTEEVQRFLAAHPETDAIVAANDDYAKRIIEDSDRISSRIGEDLSIIGFDDQEYARYLKPALATVRADASALGEEAVEKASAFLSEADSRGLPLHIPDESYKIRTKFICRKSASGKPDPDIPRDAMEYVQKYHDAVHLIHQMNIVSRELLYNIEKAKVDELAIRTLQQLDIRRASLFFLRTPRVHVPIDHWERPKHLVRAAVMRNGKVMFPQEKEKIVRTDGIFTSEFFMDEPGQYLVIDLFSKEEQYGLLIVDLPMENLAIQESLTTFCGMITRTSYLFAQNQALVNQVREQAAELEKRNILLDSASKTDILTDQLNRRGFLKEAQRILDDPQNMGKTVLVCYADMNYLKKVNDGFGHQAGDHALVMCAKAVRSAMKVAGRIGGDEFAGITALSRKDDDKLPDISRQIKTHLRGQNILSDEKFLVTISVGTASAVIHSGMNIGELLSEADQNLYEDKKNKGPFQMRE